MKSMIRNSVAAVTLIVGAASVSAQAEMASEQGGAEQQTSKQTQSDSSTRLQERQHGATDSRARTQQHAQEPSQLYEKSENRYEGLQNGTGRLRATPQQIPGPTQPGLAAEQKGRGMEGQNVQPSMEGRSSLGLSSNQETQIRQHVINERSARVDHVEFAVAVGTIVPRHLHFVPLPRQVVKLVPRFRGYKFIIVEDEIVIIDPHTYRIVAVIRG